MKEINFTLASGNRKTGPIPVSGSMENTCPSACPFAPKRGKANGCYARYGAIAIHWNRLNHGQSGIAWNEFLVKIKGLMRGQLWRHCQFGDLRGSGNKIDSVALAQLTTANRGKRGFGYTHKPVLDRQDKKNAASNRAAIQAANRGGFTINLSANNPVHADELKALGIGPVVSIVSQDAANTSFTPAGHKIVICPAQYRDNVTCQRCGLCAVSQRSVIVGFKTHGSGSKYVEKLVAA